MSATNELPKDFFKQFKSKEEFHSFFSDLFKQGVEEMLQAELEAHLGYPKHSKEEGRLWQRQQPQRVVHQDHQDRKPGGYGPEHPPGPEQ